jgi:hypothetical protein
MKAMWKVVSLVAVTAALTLSFSHVFAKTAGRVGPGPVHVSGISPAPSGAGGSRSKYIPYCRLHPGWGGCAPKIQPTCRGPHRGPNGLMIQCD